MSLRDKVYNIVLKDSLAYNGLDNLFCHIEKILGANRANLKKEFNKLIESGDIFELRKGKFIAIPSNGYAKGLFLGNAKGFGFVQLGQVKGEKDVFIPGNMTGGAIDGDRVIVKINARSEEGSEGEVVNVYKAVKQLVGIVQKRNSNFFLEPDNNHIPFKIRLVKGKLKYTSDDRVVIALTRTAAGNFSGEVIEVLGKSDDVKAMELSIIRDHNLYEVFPQEVINACGRISKKVTDNQRKGRVDLTKETIFTIDGEDAKDFDDAVSIKRTKSGYTLGVHIADVGEYVKKGSVIDEEAFERGTSVYFPTSVLPMLPEVLCNGICSLQEGVDRLTLTCEMEVNKKGEVTSHKIYESVIRSKARLTYNQVHAALNGETNKASKVIKELQIMAELSKILEERRNNAGNLDFEIPEAQFIFDENGMAIGVERRERNEAHRLIEDFMVLANETVAKEFRKKDVPFVYRVHESPNKEKLIKVKEFMQGLGIAVPPIPDIITPPYYQDILKRVEGHDYTDIVNKVLLRSMQKARYSNQNLGHFGLALEYYCHFTSPIRRYPDLTIHRIIKETLHKKNMSKARRDELELFSFESSEQSSLTERNAEKAEREVDDLWKAYLMKDKIGQTFEGVITSVTNYGLFIELENTVEGLLRIEDLPQDGYLFFENQLKLKGSKYTFTIGDKIKVILANANIFTRKVDFGYKN